MIKMYRYFLLFSLTIIGFLPSLPAQTPDTSPNSVAELEGIPSAIANGSVNVITGSYVESNVDLVIPGAKPLLISRSYCSGDLYPEGQRLDGGWVFNHSQTLKFFEGRTDWADLTPNKEIKGASLSELSGATVVYSKDRSKSEGPELSVDTSLYFCDGLTNCGSGIIGARTNLKNTRIEHTPRHYKQLESTVVYGGDGSVRHYKCGGPSQCYFPVLEEQADGFSLHYTPAKRPSIVFPLNHIALKTPRGNEVSHLDIQALPGRKQEVCLKASDGREVHVKGDAVSDWRGRTTIYERHKWKRFITERKELHGTFLRNEYDKDGKVTQQFAPVGYDEQAVPTYSYHYRTTELSKYGRRKKEGTTEVRDPLGNRVDYHWDRCKRLTGVDTYESTGEIVSKERLVWGDLDSQDACNLVVRSISDGAGHPLMATTYHYDERGNPLVETLWGNLSGHSDSPLLLDEKGYPIDNGCEKACTYRRYSNDRFNLLLEEELPDGKVHRFHYVPDSDRIAAKFTGDRHGILKREFYSYDADGILVCFISDDGSSTNIDDLTGVHCRQVKRYTPRKEAPAVGLPAEEAEYYLDLDSGEEKLLKKLGFRYSLFGQLDAVTHYDANGDYLYEVIQHHADGLSVFDPQSVEENLRKLNNAEPPMFDGEVDYSVDPLGRSTSYSYDYNGNLLTEEPNYLDYVIHHQYDNAHRRVRSEKRFINGRVESQSQRYDRKSQKIADIDSFGNETHYRYDARGNMVERVAPPTLDANGMIQEAKEQWVYDSLGREVQHIDANGHLCTKDYNIRGQVTLISYPNGTEEHFRYSLGGKLEERCFPNGVTTRFEYDALGQTTKEESYDRDGNFLYSKDFIYEGTLLVASIDPEGNCTYFEYDGAARKTGEICEREDGQAQRTYTEYDAVGRPYKQRFVFEEGESIKTCSYDILNRIVEEKVEDQSGKLIRWKGYAYDTNGKLCRSSEQGPQGETISSYTVHDNLGRPILEIDPDGNETHIEYDVDHRNSLGQRVLKVTHTDPLGRKVVTIHDALGRASETTVRDSFGIVLAHCTLSYDGKGQKTERKDAVLGAKNERLRWSTVRWEYNSMGQLTRQLQAVGTPLQKETRTQYDAFGQKASVVKPNGAIVYYDHDALGRIKHLHSSDKTVDIHYSYDSCGRMLSATDAAGDTAIERTYNACGWLMEEKIDGVGTTAYRYDARGRCIQQVFPDQSCVNYGYGAEDLESVTRFDSSGKELYSHRYTEFDLSGRILEAELAGGLGTLSNRWDRLGRAAYIRSPYWEEKVPSSGGYNSVGLLTHARVTDHEGELDQHFDYDARYQLQSEKGEFSHQYQNDSLNNRLSKDGQACESNALNQLTSDGSSTYSYDDCGNLLQEIHEDGSHTDYRYDALDRLTEVKLPSGTTVQMAYDALHRRIRRTVNGQTTRYWYQGQNEVAAVQDDRPLEFRTLGIGLGAEIGAAVAIEIGEQCYAPIHDHRGNVCTLIDLQTKEVAESYRYGAFGEERILSTGSGFSGNAWRFSSKRMDPETQLVYFGRRYYQPKTGRWISADPIGYEDGPNLYAYVKNQPLTHWDKYGLSAFCKHHSSQARRHRNAQINRRAFRNVRVWTGRFIQGVAKHALPGCIIREGLETAGQWVSYDDTSKSSFYGAKFYEFATGDASLNLGKVLVTILGIMSSEESIKEAAERRSEANGGAYVVACGRISRGFLADLLQGGIFDKFGGYKTDSASAAKTIQAARETVEKHGSLGQTYLVCHSRGAQIGKGALDILPNSTTDNMDVRAFGGATMIPADAAGTVVNYTYVGDPVGMFVGGGLLKAFLPGTNVKFLGPSGSFPLPRHVFDCAPYKKVRQELVLTNQPLF